DRLRRLVQPTRATVLAEIRDTGVWLRTFTARPDWDGGDITFTFAGHGRDTDGGLVLQDGILTPAQFIEAVVDVAERLRANAPNRLRVSFMLDSCYAAAFLTDFLGDAISRHESRLFPYYLGASCMADEVAWEDSTLGHGIFTYCWSVREK